MHIVIVNNSRNSYRTNDVDKHTIPQIFNVIDKYWCDGESCYKRGRFPSSHLHKVEVPSIKDSEKLYLSIAPFRGEQDGDLSFDKGK